MTRSFITRPRKPSTRRQWVLGVLLLLTGLMAVLLLLVSLDLGGRSAMVVRDANRSASLRDRGLRLYATTHGGGADWRPQAAAMAAMRDRLRTRYPQDVAATDPAWGALLRSLQRTGRVDWPTADALRVADGALTRQLMARAAAADAASSHWLWLSLGLVITSLAVAGRLLGGLRAPEDALLAQHEFQKALLESLQEGIVACDAAGTLTLFNRATREFHGLPEQALPAEQWAQHFDLYDVDGLTPMRTEDIPLFRALQGEVVRRAEMVIAPRDGERRTIVASGQAIYGADGGKLGAVVAMHDVTQRRMMERELTRLAAIVESSEEAIIAGTLDGTIVSWNAGAERLYGYAASEVIGRHVSVLGRPHEEQMGALSVARLRRGEAAEPAEVAYARRDGTVVDLSLSCSPIRDSDGGMVGVSCISRDITARRRAEDALRESRRFAESIADYSTSIIFVFDLDTQANVYANRNVGEFLGYSTDQVQAMEGDLLSEMLHPDDLHHVLSHFGQFADKRDGEVVDIEYRARHADGEWRWIWNREVVFERHADGTPRQIMGTAQDITDRKRAAAALEESGARLAEAQRVAQVGSWEFDVATGEIGWSDQLFRLFGKDPADGEPDLANAIALYHPDDAPTLEALVARAAQTGVGYELDLRRAPDGGPDRWYHTVGTAVTDGEGRVVRLAGTLTDVTERKALEADLRERAERLRRSEAALRAVLESAPVILYATDAGGTITLSEGTGLTALGLKPGEAVGRSVFEFTDGNPGAEEKTRRALAGEALSYEMQYGSLRLHVELRPVRGAGGEPAGLIGVSFDVTERALSEQRFRVLFEHSSHPHFLFDEGGIIDCNAAAVTALRCADKAELLALHPAVLSPDLQPDGRHSMEKCLEMDRRAREEGFYRFEWMHRRLDGEEFPAEVTLTPVTLNERPVLLVVWYDLTERKRAERQAQDYRVVLEFQKAELERANAELAALATTDGLTGLLNHRAFQERLAEEYGRAGRYDTPLSVMLLDVDHFKQYNDTFGHPAGDAVLRRVAAVLRECVRGTDLVARYGGEEFVVILPQTDAEGACAIAERVRAAIEDDLTGRRRITVSIGVSTLALSTTTPAAMIVCADAALYHSKGAGRNRVTHHDGAIERATEEHPLPTLAAGPA